MKLLLIHKKSIPSVIFIFIIALHYMNTSAFIQKLRVRGAHVQQMITNTF